MAMGESSGLRSALVAGVDICEPCSVWAVLWRPLPLFAVEATSSSEEGGGVEKRRGCDCGSGWRMVSHGSADGRSIVAR